MNNIDYIDFLKSIIEANRKELRRVLNNLKETEARGKKINENLRESVELALPTPTEIIEG